MRGVFVTGTDTGVGKTRVSAALVRALRAQGVAARGMKPVASGCEPTPQGLRNDDALALRDAADAPDYALVNPVALAEPIAPHLAARRAGVAIGIPALLDAHAALARGAQFLVVEGVGGWSVPLSDTTMQADLANALGHPVVLVVGLRLGCLSHALLSARAIAADGLTLAGWIANVLDPDLLALDALEADLASRLGPPLARIAHGADAIAALGGCARALLRQDERST